MGAEVLVRASGLALGYGAAKVVRDVTLEVCAGETWFFLGPNGSGKTTLLRAILGLLAPQAGTLALHPELADRAHRGYVPQRGEWNPALPTTVREFVSLGFVGSDARRADRAGRLAWALGRIGLGALADADFRSLSGGQRQRALVARALVRRPRLLLLDEPTEELDVVSEAALLDALAELVETEGTTLLFVTHELEIAKERATHVALFAGGRVAAGPRAELLAPGRLEHAFGDALRGGRLL
jgi:ABC-type Mn2+/Zn2+ transport system ATPase subunit